MPNDNKLPNNSDQPIGVTPPPVLTDDILPPNLDQVNPSPVASTNSGSAAPTDDVVMPPVTTPIETSTPKKKFAGGKVIATILGLFLLVGGVGAGVFLTGQNQNIEEKAAAETPAECIARAEALDRSADDCVFDHGCTWEVCTTWSDGVCVAWGATRYNSCSSGGSEKPFNKGGDCPTGTVVNYNLLLETIDLCRAPYDGTNYELGTAEKWGDCCRWDSKANGCDAGEEGCCLRRKVNVYACYSTSTSTPEVASCQNIKAYDADWTLLTDANLKSLKTGNIVNFCVTGTATGGSFNKAKFTINSVEQAETTTVRPTTTDFCQSYTIPAGITAFNVTAQINHTTLGWK